MYSVELQQSNYKQVHIYKSAIDLLSLIRIYTLVLEPLPK
jgi:hypothetical protein